VEKRNYPRVKVIFPFELTDKCAKNYPTSCVGIINNLSETGAKVVSDKLMNFPTSIYVNLPPCYSNDPKNAKGIEIQIRDACMKNMVSANKFVYGVTFSEISEPNKAIIKNIISYEINHANHLTTSVGSPKIDIHREIHSCNMYAVDLTVGCENDCKYCHFSIANTEIWQKKYPSATKFPIPVDISPIYTMDKLPETVIYLSPSSDAFAPAARELTHELLEFMLPRKVIFTISTKSIVPDKTIKLLRKYKSSIEGIAMGLTNLDDARNALLEPGCPPAKERLSHIRKLKEIGCFIGARMDPIFPGIDDTDQNINVLVKAIVAAGAQHITGTYLFTFGKFLKDFSKMPLLKDGVKLMTSKTYPMGGVAISVSMEYKIRMYTKIGETCKSHGIKFNTCGCKDVILKNTGYPLVCRNIDYYKK
jgi:DNA repair photolyase